MSWTVVTQDQFQTAVWSGGTTTQLAIAPEGAAYADREFLWRLSSAAVEADHSDFTPLPDYNRLISVVEGDLDLRIGAGDRFPLRRLTVCSFDGGTPVESWGRCVDFNLMLRKGRCQGSVQSLTLAPASAVTWTPAVPAPRTGSQYDAALYCVSGKLELPELGLAAQAGQLLLCRKAEETAPLSLQSGVGAALLAAVIEYK